MSQFINDLINLTQGQLLVKYWWLWISIVSIAVLPLLYDKLKRRG